MNVEQFLASFDWAAFGNQFLYDSKNPLLFNNGFFVYFFSLFILLFFALRHQHQARRYVFCLFSLYFFYKASGWFVGLVILSAIVDFFLSNAIYKAKQKSAKTGLLVLSIIFNLGMLFYFKYTNFFISISNEWLNTDFNPLNILLPIGISFYTFENLSYTIDVYRGDFKPASKFSDYLLFLAFFPKLMMGPIVRAHDFVPQINEPYVISEKDFAKGFYLIISGLIKKLIISDFITLNFVDYVFDNPALHTGLENLFAVYGYAMVIYCDFSGYSDIAIGIALWLGFKIPPNFLSPYQSKNITEFWRRWHISLSSWLKDYLYIPLGGNRKFSVASFLFVSLFLVGVFLMGVNLFHLSYAYSGGLSAAMLLIFLLPALITRDSKGIAANFNLLTTMLLGGFWHGASWNFIIWGAIHGVGLGIHKIWMLLTGKALKKVNNTFIYKVIMGLVTFHFVCFGWVFFKAEDFEIAKAMLFQIFYNFDVSVFMPFYENYQEVLWMIGFAMLIHLIPDGLVDKLLDKPKTIPLVFYIMVFFCFLLLYGFFKSSEQVMPIYLQF
ncbi:MBOAT family O-acyltransferase [Riemerella anatipestifer]|uniref:Peptidoglycan O-acetyltransferase n=1 Tax=Riemerella anatipestifer TaxID=34085 RepID=A0A1S7DS95_RIEAN|nr:MBOAT family O-acyltransferase [Riemerella anatipestifer]AQY22002.1 Peptidoglycan O-acetyltransferase [Riemerella anatipestifer]MCO4303954.1 MBOAT family protein [Riemerella anatipestifer]MCO7352552.1 MBOAT family protein [Riemerella anatipestifer]MCQ4039278.1 MBOAT family protein [Riemerella anatipestifer]MCT6760924.1 MBOAT family protein [Riemerella anatipestifer]